MIADYFIVRRRELNVRRSVPPRRRIRIRARHESASAGQPGGSASSVALVGLVVPSLRWLYDYAWFVGFAVSAVVTCADAQRVPLTARDTGGWLMMAKPAIEGLAEHLPRLSAHEALVEANRCLFCYDAPCTHACPTHIDIPRFIKKSRPDNLIGSARTILESNLLGATCARVCPVQELCEGACVLGAEHKPIMIGRLQRYAMDYVYGRGIERFQQSRRQPGGKWRSSAPGPAGLSCAGELARRGHGVTSSRSASLPGGLSTYGIIVAARADRGRRWRKSR